MPSQNARLILSIKEYERYVQRSKTTISKSNTFSTLNQAWASAKQHLDIKKTVKSLLKMHQANVICNHFSRYFTFEVAKTDAQNQQAYKLRYEVYCKELSFEPLRASEQETDEFDAHSSYCLINHKATNTYAGTVRIVNSSEEHGELLPIEKYCLNTITDLDYSPMNFPRSEICEISRLAVPAQFRRRQVDKFPGAATGAFDHNAYSEKELRSFAFIAVGLYFSAASLALKLGKKHAYVMMEPRLARNMRFVGIRFRQIGPVVDYHGKRAPYYINADLLHRHLSSGFKTMLARIKHAIDAQ